MLPADLLFLASRFGFLQNPNDLFFTESLPIHGEPFRFLLPETHSRSGPFFRGAGPIAEPSWESALIETFDPGVSLQLKQIPLEAGRSVQCLLGEAINLLYQSCLGGSPQLRNKPSWM